MMSFILLIEIEDVELIQQLSGKPSIDVNNVMIVGAGKIGDYYQNPFNMIIILD